MIVGVTGASGFIGKKTIKILKDSGHEVKRFVRREVKNDDEIYWSPAKKEIDKDKFQELDAIIHLAGESIAPQDILGFLPFAGGRWSKERKSRIYWSGSGHLIFLWIHTNLVKNIQKYLLLHLEMIFMEITEMR